MKNRIPDNFTQEEFEDKINEIGIENITELDIHNCLYLSEIPCFLNLKILDCLGTSIKSFPFIENLEKLCCSFCQNLLEIPNFPNLKQLVCAFSSSIASIHPMEKLEELDCNYCQNLLEIPYLPNLKELDCSFTNIKSIPLMEKLEELHCSLCPNLFKIPHFPNLKELLRVDYHLKIKFYNKNLRIHFFNTIQIFQGRLFQNTYSTYELLIF